MIQVQIDATEQGVETVRIRHEGGRAATLDVLERLMPHIKAMTTSVGRLTREPDRTPAT